MASVHGLQANNKSFFQKTYHKKWYQQMHDNNNINNIFSDESKAFFSDVSKAFLDPVSF